MSYILKGVKLVYMDTPKMDSLIDGHPCSICLDLLLLPGFLLLKQTPCHLLRASSSFHSIHPLQFAFVFIDKPITILLHPRLFRNQSWQQNFNQWQYFVDRIASFLIALRNNVC